MKKKEGFNYRLKFACTNYFSSHKNALKKDFEVRIIPVGEILKKLQKSCKSNFDFFLCFKIYFLFKYKQNKYCYNC